MKTKAEAQGWQLFFINCWLPTERWLILRGRVTYRLSKVGFGISFNGLTGAEREMLWMLLDFFGEAANTAREPASPTVREGVRKNEKN
ncbi:MAG: hypothetical protein LC802_07905 [Acidobacteria bacterium]|nr:hypothetical protein [Acidobacteriota bacterium]